MDLPDSRLPLSCLSFCPPPVTHILPTTSRLIHFKCYLHHIETLLKNLPWILLSKHTKHKLFYLGVKTTPTPLPSFWFKFIYWDSPTNTSGSPSHCVVKGHIHWKLHCFLHELPLIPDAFHLWLRRYNPEASMKHFLLTVTIIRPHLLSTPVSLITLPGKWLFITQVSFMVFRHITIIITYLRRGTMLITSVCFPTTKTVLKYRKHLKTIDQFQCTSTSNKKLEHYISAHFWIHKAFFSHFSSNGSGFQVIKRIFFLLWN